MDIVERIGGLDFPFLARCRIPRDLASVVSRGEEEPPRAAGISRAAVERVWARTLALYRSGVHPAIQLCIRRRGHVVLSRAVGHAAGNAPDDPADAPKIPVTTATPINIFSAAKAVTAMVIHKLDEQRLLHLEDRVCEYIPEFARHGKSRITIRHILAHRAGIPNLPPGAVDLDLLAHPDRILRILCDSRPQTRPGRILAYHAVTGGFVLAEVVRRATGRSLREVARKEIAEPLGLRWLHYGVAAEDVPWVARNAATGPPVPPLLAQLLRRAFGVELRRAVALSNDPRFLTGLIPSTNLVTTAEDLAAFYQCLLDEGELSGVRIFDPRTVRHATSEQNVYEIDLTLALPIRYGLGFMLGSEYLSLYGWNHPQAFGHLGLTNILSWADPERRLAVALLTTGKPVLSLHGLRLAQLLAEIHRAFPRERGSAILPPAARVGRAAQAPPAAARAGGEAR
jgi:CubicO group peptidase (beta-lactamase class C family)